MKYLLSEEEYQDLIRVKEYHEKAYTDALQKFCTLAAEHIPITRKWNKEAEPTPWGCILSEENDSWYCDACPVQNICPYSYKKWSK